MNKAVCNVVVKTHVLNVIKLMDIYSINLISVLTAIVFSNRINNSVNRMDYHVKTIYVVGVVNTVLIVKCRILRILELFVLNVRMAII